MNDYERCINNIQLIQQKVIASVKRQVFLFNTYKINTTCTSTGIVVIEGLDIRSNKELKDLDNILKGWMYLDTTVDKFYADNDPTKGGLIYKVLLEERISVEHCHILAFLSGGLKKAMKNALHNRYWVHIPNIDCFHDKFISEAASSLASTYSNLVFEDTREEGTGIEVCFVVKPN